MTTETCEQIKAIATAVTALTTIFGVVLVVKQLKQQSAASVSQFMLQLREMFSAFDDIHAKLRPYGEWQGPSSEGPGGDEWVRVDSYMGLFELCEHLMQRGMLDSRDFKDLYSYRLENLVANQHIVEAKLIMEKESWKTFTELLERCAIQDPAS